MTTDKSTSFVVSFVQAQNQYIILLFLAMDYNRKKKFGIGSWLERFFDRLTGIDGLEENIVQN